MDLISTPANKAYPSRTYISSLDPALFPPIIEPIFAWLPQKMQKATYSVRYFIT
jgi:hypothetical protein